MSDYDILNNNDNIQGSLPSRVLRKDCLEVFMGKCKVENLTRISYHTRGDDDIKTLQLYGLEQLVEVGQTRALLEVSDIHRCSYGIATVRPLLPAVLRRSQFLKTADNRDADNRGLTVAILIILVMLIVHFLS